MLYTKCKWKLSKKKKNVSSVQYTSFFSPPKSIAENASKTTGLDDEVWRLFFYIIFDSPFIYTSGLYTNFPNRSSFVRLKLSRYVNLFSLCAEVNLTCQYLIAYIIIIPRLLAGNIIKIQFYDMYAAVIVLKNNILFTATKRLYIYKYIVKMKLKKGGQNSFSVPFEYYRNRFISFFGQLF